MRVSVLMPAYNAEHFAARSIDGILAQTHTDWELLVADDGSTDGTRELVERYTDSRIRFHHNQSRCGYVTTCNKLFRAARGDLVTFQDADDWSAPTRLARQVAAFTADPGLGMCGTWIHIVDDAGRTLRARSYPTSDAEIRESFLERNPFCGATIMVRRAVLDAVGGYREALDGYSHQDYDRSCRALERFTAINVPEELYFYRQHEASNARRIDVRRAIGFNLMRALAIERRERGSDCLMRGDRQAFEALLTKLTERYSSDPSLLHREYAGTFIDAHMHKAAVRASWGALVRQPFRLVNLRTLLYCARQGVLESVRGPATRH